MAHHEGFLSVDGLLLRISESMLTGVDGLLFRDTESRMAGVDGLLVCMTCMSHKRTSHLSIIHISITFH